MEKEKTCTQDSTGSAGANNVITMQNVKSTVC